MMILPPTEERQKDQEPDPAALRKLLASRKAAKESPAGPHEEEQKQPPVGDAGASANLKGLDLRIPAQSLSLPRERPAALQGRPAQSQRVGWRPNGPSTLGPSAQDLADGRNDVPQSDTGELEDFAGGFRADRLGLTAQADELAKPSLDDPAARSQQDA